MNSSPCEGFKLHVKEEGDKTRPDRDEPRGTMVRMGVRQGTQLKCTYTSACRMVNKQEELEATVQQANYDLAAIMETWWDCSHDWIATMNGYELFRRGRQGRRSGDVAPSVREL